MMWDYAGNFRVTGISLLNRRLRTRRRLRGQRHYFTTDLTDLHGWEFKLARAVRCKKLQTCAKICKETLKRRKKMMVQMRLPKSATIWVPRFDVLWRELWWSRSGTDESRKNQEKPGKGGISETGDALRLTRMARMEPDGRLRLTRRLGLGGG